MIRGSLRHPGRWIWLLLVLPAALGISRLRFDTDIFNLLPHDLPVVQGLRAYQNNFSTARELILTIAGPEADSVEQFAGGLAAALRKNSNLVTSVTWRPPWLEHPDQAAELIAFLWLNQPPEAVQQLTNRLAAQNAIAALAEAKEVLGSSLSPSEIARLSYDPLGITRLPEAGAGTVPSFAEGEQAFASADGTFRLIYVKAASELNGFRECQDWLREVRRTVDGVLATSDRPPKVRFTGRPVFVSEAATGMQQDISGSVGGTAVIIVLLFWIAHRRLKPLLWLLTLLALVLATTLALGGLFFGTINVISLGFAAILLGLAVDYALIDYQEALAHPELSVAEVRGMVAPGVSWAAATTMVAFLALNLGGLPGLAQLGTMVATGVLIAAIVMLFEYLPPLFPERRREAPNRHATATTERQSATSGMSRLYRNLATAGTVGVIALGGFVLLSGLPQVDPTGSALRPRESEAYFALEEIKSNLNQDREPLWLIFHAADEGKLLTALERAQTLLNHAVSNGTLASFALPTTLLPNAAHQQANLPALAGLQARVGEFKAAAQATGFNEQSLALFERVLNSWRGASPNALFWPQNDLIRWISEKTLARTPTNRFALGMLQPAMPGSNPASPVAVNEESKIVSSLAELGLEMERAGGTLSGWELLGTAVFKHVRAHVPQVLFPMVLLVMASLWLAFRRWREVLLSGAVLLMSLTALLGLMRIAGWSWNLMNLLAIPLVFGTGVDYGIFIQLALRRHHGNLSMVWRSVGKAILICGATTVAGFGSLSWSNNAGMAGFGRVCALGVACNVAVSILLLPAWWHAFAARGHRAPDRPIAPSTFYQARVWRLGLALVRILPLRLSHRLGQMLMYCYWLTAWHRRDVVTENLLPALENDLGAARRAARRLFVNFGIKIADLLRFEAGRPVKHLFGRSNGWEHFVQAQTQKRGVLLLTMHLGNWEFGAHCVTQEGYNLQVLTLAEPGSQFTELRQASRARWNVETLVVRNDPFAFVEVIRRLEAGANVALLVDRPPPETAVTVELFGRPFPASVAAAELARASGCVLLPTFLPWEGSSYGAYILPPIPYDRPTLRDRDARRALTQKIISTFEPVIKQHIDQWYHFVPLWPDTALAAPPVEHVPQKQ